MATYTITLRGVTAHGHHGVLPEERRDGQTFVVDVQLQVEREASDDLATTVDYGELARAVAADVGRDPLDLIESLADRVLATCLARGGVAAATVTIHKPQAPIPVPFDDVAVTRHGRVRARAVLSLGSNVGDSLATLRAAVARLAGLPGVAVTAVSPLYRTRPVGGVEQDDFLNLVVLAALEGPDPLELLRRTQAIEDDLGRARVVRWGPRTLDIDLVAVGTDQCAGPDLTLPHPRAHERAFVLVPWLDVDPDAALPGHGRVADLVAALDTTGVQRLDERIDLP